MKPDITGQILERLRAELRVNGRLEVFDQPMTARILGGAKAKPHHLHQAIQTWRLSGEVRVHRIRSSYRQSAPGCHEWAPDRLRIWDSSLNERDSDWPDPVKWRHPEGRDPKEPPRRWQFIESRCARREEARQAQASATGWPKSPRAANLSEVGSMLAGGSFGRVQVRRAGKTLIVGDEAEWNPQTWAWVREHKPSVNISGPLGMVQLKLRPTQRTGHFRLSAQQLERCQHIEGPWDAHGKRPQLSGLLIPKPKGR